MTIAATDQALAQMAGRLRAVTAGHGLSLGDRFCLALAQRDGLPAWTSERSWKAVANDILVEVVVIR
jgi:PIN domain nuclease of toxin-antitoxin system